MPKSGGSTKYQMEKPGIDEIAYIRLLLRQNPFIHLSSESLETVKPVHVWTDTDKRFWGAVEKTIKEKEKTLIFLVGEFGSGKTHRLRLLYETLEDLPCVYIKVDSQDSREVIRGIETAIKTLEVIPARRLKKVVLSFSKRRGSKTFGSPEEAARRAAATINRRKEAVLLMDEIENVILSNSEDSRIFANYLRSLYNELSEGKMLVVACIPQAYVAIKPLIWDVNPPPLAIRVERISDTEAEEIIDRRMRLGYDADSVDGPFLHNMSSEMISKLNSLARRNPRKLMQVIRNIVLTAPSLDDRAIQKTVFSDEASEGVAEQYSKYVSLLRASCRGKDHFSLIDASEALSISLVEVKSILKEMEKQGYVEKTGVRYALTSKALQAVRSEAG